jgi:phosphotransferase family enzyme
VLKLIRLDAGPHPRWLSRPEPGDPYYWRREPTAYASGALGRFGAPACIAAIDRDDGSVALWLEDGGDPPAWTPELLGGAARRLGTAQAAEPPDEAWVARGFLRRYLDLHRVAADSALDRIEAMPSTLCHNDLHPANVLAGGAVVDWAFCGAAARGLDAGILVADGIADGAFDPALADAVADAVWGGYLDGLRAAGWTGSEDDVRFAFARGTALRLSWLTRGDHPTWDATIDFLERLASSA